MIRLGICYWFLYEDYVVYFNHRGGSVRPSAQGTYNHIQMYTNSNTDANTYFCCLVSALICFNFLLIVWFCLLLVYVRVYIFDVFTFSTVREKNTIGPVRAGTPALTGLMELSRQLRKGLLELASQLREASWSWQASSQDHRCLARLCGRERWGRGSPNNVCRYVSFFFTGRLYLQSLCV